MRSKLNVRTYRYDKKLLQTSAPCPKLQRSLVTQNNLLAAAESLAFNIFLFMRKKFYLGNNILINQCHMKVLAVRI